MGSRASQEPRRSRRHHRASSSHLRVDTIQNMNAGTCTMLGSSPREILVKFAQRYSRDLHIFCAEGGLAPELLGFEQLPGGWFALAMEKVDIVAPWRKWDPSMSLTRGRRRFGSWLMASIGRAWFTVICDWQTLSSPRLPYARCCLLFLTGGERERGVLPLRAACWRIARTERLARLPRPTSPLRDVDPKDHS